jgi:hypothetical protein
MKKIIAVIFFIMIFSCKEKNEIFNGNIVFVKMPVEDILQGSRINDPDGIYTGSMMVYDSLMFFLSYKYPAYYGLTFNIKTGKTISHILRKGKGPTDFITPVLMEQFEIDSSICSWVCDWSKLKCILVNISDDSQIKDINVSKLPNEREQITGFFILNDSLLLSYNQGEDLYLDGYTLLPPLYRILNYRTNKEIAVYEVYNKFEYDNKKIDAQSCLFSIDRIKPDKTKLAMPMENFRQINIMDIKTGEITGYKLENTPDFNILRRDSYSEIKPCYTETEVDDELIYAAIYNEKGVSIDVFDWNGNFIRILALDLDNKKIFNIALDPVNKFIYALLIGENDEEIYRYDVSYLYKSLKS